MRTYKVTTVPLKVGTPFKLHCGRFVDWRVQGKNLYIECLTDAEASKSVEPCTWVVVAPGGVAPYGLGLVSKKQGTTAKPLLLLSDCIA